eukprot:3682510-Rhodomonas_salina.3
MSPEQIHEITVGAKRLRDNIFNFELSDPSIPKPVTGEPAPVRGPVELLHSQSTVESLDVDGWDEGRDH